MPGEQPWVTAEPPPPGDLRLRATVPKPAVPNVGARNKASRPEPEDSHNRAERHVAWAQNMLSLMETL